MEINEIFSEIATHMITGTMVHEQLMNSYLFLGLPGYSACHEYHYLSETVSYIELCKYYQEHYGRLIHSTFGGNNVPDIIPKSWGDSDRESVDKQVRKQAISAAMDEWVDWETGARDMYSRFYTELLTIPDIPAAEMVKKLILDVEEEIVYATNERLKAYAIDFDMPTILSEQQAIKKRFSKSIAIKSN